VALVLVVGCGRIGIEPIARADAALGRDGNSDGPIGDGMGAALAGTYTLDTAITYACATGLVDISVTTFTFAPNGTMLGATSNDPGAPQQPCVMLGPTPTAGGFDVTCTLSGACNEIYRLTGTIVDSKHWTGAFTATYSGTCLNCTMQTFPRTASAP
jgi:hypothetical protein